MVFEIVLATGSAVFGATVGLLLQIKYMRRIRDAALRQHLRLLLPFSRGGDPIWVVMSSFRPYSYYCRLPSTAHLVKDLIPATHPDPPVALLKECGERKLMAIRYDEPVLPSHDWAASLLFAQPLVALLGVDSVKFCLDSDFTAQSSTAHSVIALGSSVSNDLTRMILENHNPTALSIEGSASHIVFKDSDAPEDWHRWPMNSEDAAKNDYGMMLRIPWKADKWALILAGPGGGATQGIAAFVASAACADLFGEHLDKDSALGLVVAFARGRPDSPQPVAMMVGTKLELLLRKS